MKLEVNRGGLVGIAESLKHIAIEACRVRGILEVTQWFEKRGFFALQNGVWRRGDYLNLVSSTIIFGGACKRSRSRANARRCLTGPFWGRIVRLKPDLRSTTVRK